MLRFHVQYADPQALARDHESQFQKGGLLVRVEPPVGLERLAPVELEIETLAGRLVLAAHVVQPIDGVGVALSFTDGAGALDALLAETLAAGDLGAEGPPVAYSVCEGTPGTAADDSEEPAEGSASVASDVAAKVHLAKHGNKEERMRIMRGGDRSLHRYVLRNPGLRLDEVVFIAKMTAVSVDLLKAIAERRDWAQRPEIALALVRNPKTPVPLAIQLLAHVQPAELRRLAKGGSLRMPILQAARKRVLA